MNRPTCAVCQKPVDVFEVTEDPDFMRRVVLLARCHGETERVVIGIDDFRQMTRGRMAMGLAFQGSTERLT